MLLGTGTHTASITLINTTTLPAAVEVSWEVEMAEGGGGGPSPFLASPQALLVHGRGRCVAT